MTKLIKIPGLKEGFLEHSIPKKATYFRAQDSCVLPRITLQELLRLPFDSSNDFGIRRDINVSVGPGISAIEGSTFYNILQALRVLKVIRFTRPMPVVESCEVWSYFTFHSFWIVVDRLTRGVGGRMTYHESLNSYYMEVRDDLPRPAQEYDAQSGTSIIDTCAFLLHERRHIEKSHNCNAGSDDSSLAYGGAWALQYWFLLWCANYTGDFFREETRIHLVESASRILDTRVCGSKKPLVRWPK